ncbi:MAG TPA: YXWGXW repeat-containing protein, partial [Verrucomicrobiae bacterium]
MKSHALLGVVTVGFIISGCSTPAARPVAHAYVEPRPILNADQMGSLCKEAPETCHRVQTAQPLTVEDVKVMVKLGFDSYVIIDQIRNSRTVYHLSASQILDLKEVGAKNDLLDFLLTTPASIAGASPEVEVANGSAAQIPPPSSVPERAPPSPGPDYAWVEGNWVWNGGWVWVGGH